MPPSQRLHIRFLGASGFTIERANEAVLTAPLFTRPTLVDVASGVVQSNPSVVGAHLPTAALSNVRAVLSGHAHYDHLLDVPDIMERAPRAMLFANRSAKNILSAYAPDRGARCAGTSAAGAPIARSRVVAMDDAWHNVVDYTMCPQMRPPNAPARGTWLTVPGAHVRVMAVCSEHPEQLGPIHYAPGGVEDEQCALPRAAADWREGQTLAFVIDFLDWQTNAPLYRVYYQDAPTNAPNGHLPPALLSEKRVDVALMCVGAYEHVADAPAPTLSAMQPRFALGGHWEDFFMPANVPPQPIPMMDLATWVNRANAAMPATNDGWGMNGAAAPGRVIVPRPGDFFEVP
jgi:hypothetical protein